MKFYGNPTAYARDKESRQAEHQRVSESLKLRGTEIRPQPPREIVPQSGARKAVVSWKKPQISGDIRKWRIYKGTERNLYTELSDPSVTQVEVTLDSGATPPVTNIFISSVNAYGKESQRVQVQCSATAETGAPTDPPPPPPPDDGGDWDEPWDMCFTGNTLLRFEHEKRPFETAVEGEMVYSRGVLRRIKKVLCHEFSGELLKIPASDWGVTDNHIMLMGGWVPASLIFENRFPFIGKVWNLEIEAETFDERCYDLANGMTAHNAKTL